MTTAPFILVLTFATNCAAITSLQRAAQENAPSSFSAVSPEQGNAAPAAQAQTKERININTATASELTRLPGIGPILAANIIEHRRKHGRFKRPQEIVIVRRMSVRLYRQIAHLIHI